MENIPQDPIQYRQWWQEQRPDIPYGTCWCGCGQESSKYSYSQKSKLYFRGEPSRFLRGHNRCPKPFSNLPYKEQDGGYHTSCWIWQRFTNPHGYGYLTVGNKNVAAYRHYYEREHGPIDPDKELDHLCRNRGCVRPLHLQEVGHRENTRRGNVAKLDTNEVLAIKDLAEQGYSNAEIARQFGVTSGAVWRIVKGINWRDI